MQHRAYYIRSTPAYGLVCVFVGVCVLEGTCAAYCVLRTENIFVWAVAKDLELHTVTFAIRDAIVYRYLGLVRSTRSLINRSWNPCGISCTGHRWNRLEEEILKCRVPSVTCARTCDDESRHGLREKPGGKKLEEKGAFKGAGLPPVATLNHYKIRK